MKIELTTEKEDITPEHAEKIHGYAPGFAQAVRKVKEESEGGWWWCTVKLTVTFKKNGENHQGTAYLGECSYKNAEDFITSSGYFNDMVKEAIIDAKPMCGRNRQTAFDSN